MKWVPLMEGRRAYPLAYMIAELKNIMGGKRKPPDPKPGDPPRDPPLQPWELYTPEEELPYYAWMKPPPPMLTLEQARLLTSHYSALPEWAKPHAKMNEAAYVLELETTDS